METAKVEDVFISEATQNRYYPVINDVRVMRSKLNNAVYLEINGMSRSFKNGGEREFCTCYMAETPLQMKKLIEKHIGAGCGIKEPEYPVKSTGEDFDCMIGDTRTSWACLQGYLIKQLKRDDPYGDMERVFQEKGLGTVFRILRRDIMNFTDIDNTQRPESLYQHNIFMKRIKGITTQVLPYIPEHLQKDDNVLFCLIKSAITGEKLWDWLYSDKELWQSLSDIKRICLAEEDFYKEDNGKFEKVYLKEFLDTHFPRVAKEVKGTLGKETYITLIRKGIFSNKAFDFSKLNLPEELLKDKEVGFEAVRAGVCSYGFPLPTQFLQNDSTVAEYIMTLHMKEINKGGVYRTYDYPAAGCLVKDFGDKLRWMAEDRGRGETEYELAEMVIRIYEENHQCRSGLRELEAVNSQDFDAVNRENEALKERVRSLEEELQKKEGLERAVFENNEKVLECFLRDVMPVTGVLGRLSDGHADRNIKEREICLSSVGRLFYFTVDLLDPKMMDRLSADIRSRSGDMEGEIGRKLLAVADVCDYRGGNDYRQREYQWKQSLVAEQNPALKPATEQEDRNKLFFESGLSL